MKNVKIICSNRSNPTIFFMKHDGLEMLVLLDGAEHKKVHYKVFENFKLETIELISYEV